MPRWLLFTLIAVLCWGVWAVLGKLTGDSVTAAQSQALSTLGILPILVVLARHGLVPARGRSLNGVLAAFFSGVLTCAGNIAFYHALNAGAKAATVVPLTALYPLVTVLLAMVVLREQLNRIQMAGVVFSLIAIALFNNASVRGVADSGLGYALVPVVLWGASGLLQKLSTNFISAERSTFWFLAAFVPVAGVLLLQDPLAGLPAPRLWIILAALGVFFSLGNYAILLAFSLSGKASVIAPVAGLYPVVSVPIAIAFLGERVSQRETLGIAIALFSAVALAWDRSAPPPENSSTP